MQQRRWLSLFYPFVCVIIIYLISTIPVSSRINRLLRQDEGAKESEEQSPGECLEMMNNSVAYYAWKRVTVCLNFGAAEKTQDITQNSGKLRWKDTCIPSWIRFLFSSTFFHTFSTRSITIHSTLEHSSFTHWVSAKPFKPILANLQSSRWAGFDCKNIWITSSNACSRNIV